MTPEAEWQPMVQTFPVEISRDCWVGSSRDIQGGVYPNAVNIACPSCGVKANFPIKPHENLKAHKTLVALMNCPGCGTLVRFLGLYADDTAPDKASEPIYFAALTERTAIYRARSFLEIPNGRLRNSMESAINAFNAKNYAAALNGARRSVEGILKETKPSIGPKTSLFTIIETVAKNPTLSTPLTELAHQLREAGNRGSHFDEAFEPTAVAAHRALELMEYLAEYFLLLPTKVDMLKDVLSSET